MKWLRRPSPFHMFTNLCMINRFIFGQGVVIYLQEALHPYFPTFSTYIFGRYTGQSESPLGQYLTIGFDLPKTKN